MDRAKRAFKYVVLLGILFWGLVTASLFSLLYPIIKLGLTTVFNNPSIYWQFIVRISPNVFIYFPIGGFLWGLLMWILIEVYGEKDSDIETKN